MESTQRSEISVVSQGSTSDGAQTEENRGKLDSPSSATGDSPMKPSPGNRDGDAVETPVERKRSVRFKLGKPKGAKPSNNLTITVSTDSPTAASQKSTQKLERQMSSDSVGMLSVTSTVAPQENDAARRKSSVSMIPGSPRMSVVSESGEISPMWRRRRSITSRKILKTTEENLADVTHPFGFFKKTVEEYKEEFGFRDAEEVRQLERLVGELQHNDLCRRFQQFHPLPESKERTIRPQPTGMIVTSLAPPPKDEEALRHAGREVLRKRRDPNTARKPQVPRASATALKDIHGLNPELLITASTGAVSARHVRTGSPVAGSPAAATSQKISPAGSPQKRSLVGSPKTASPRHRSKVHSPGVSENSDDSIDDGDLPLAALLTVGQAKELEEVSPKASSFGAPSVPSPSAYLHPAPGIERQHSSGGSQSQLTPLNSPMLRSSLSPLPPHHQRMSPPPPPSRHSSGAGGERHGNVSPRAQLPPDQPSLKPKVRRAENPFHERFLRLDRIDMSERQEKLRRVTEESIEHLQAVGLLRGLGNTASANSVV